MKPFVTILLGLLLAGCHGPPKPPLPPRLVPAKRATTSPPPRPESLYVPPFALQASIADGNPNPGEYLAMFRASFQTQPNHVYGLEASGDLTTWQPRPPEIEGTGFQEHFFDALTPSKNFYRVNAREGVIDPDQTIVPVPVTVTDGRLVAQWYSPPYVVRTNISHYIQADATCWIPEWSTNGSEWNLWTSVGLSLPSRQTRALNRPCLDCLHFVETSNTFSHPWQLRIRRVPWL